MFHTKNSFCRPGQFTKQERTLPFNALLSPSLASTSRRMQRSCFARPVTNTLGAEGLCPSCVTCSLISVSSCPPEPPKPPCCLPGAQDVFSLLFQAHGRSSQLSAPPAGRAAAGSQDCILGQGQTRVTHPLITPAPGMSSGVGRGWEAERHKEGKGRAQPRVESSRGWTSTCCATKGSGCSSSWDFCLTCSPAARSQGEVL